MKQKRIVQVMAQDNLPLIEARSIIENENAKGVSNAKKTLTNFPLLPTKSGIPIQQLIIQKTNQRAQHQPNGPPTEKAAT